MTVQECAPELNKRIVFNSSAVHFLPDCSGCYCIANVLEEVLYIGQTQNLSARMVQHTKDQRIRQKTTKGLASLFYFCEVPVMDLLNKEKELLGRYIFAEGVLPPLNRQGP